jgi:putative transposase
VRPEYRDLDDQVVQNVLHRFDKAFQAFLRRGAVGAAPGYPRIQAHDRYQSIT